MFFLLYRTIITGWKRSLTNDDIFRIRKQDSSEVIVPKFEKYWKTDGGDRWENSEFILLYNFVKYRHNCSFHLINIGPVQPGSYAFIASYFLHY